jgi:hypothetical protein
MTDLDSELVEQIKRIAGTADTSSLRATMLSTTQKQQIVEVADGRLGARQIHKIFTSITASTIQGWLSNHRYGFMLLPQGRPTLLDDEAAENMRESTYTSVKNQNGDDAQTVEKNVMIGMAETAARRGRSHHKSTASSASLHRIANARGVKPKKCQHKPKERIKAEADHRTVYSLAVAAEAVVKGVAPSFVMNMDSSTFNIKLNASTHVATVDWPGFPKLKIPPTKAEGLTIHTTVRYFILSNALGKVAAPIFVIGRSAYKCLPILKTIHN